MNVLNNPIYLVILLSQLAIFLAVLANLLYKPKEIQYINTVLDEAEEKAKLEIIEARKQLQLAKLAAQANKIWADGMYDSVSKLKNISLDISIKPRKTINKK